MSSVISKFSKCFLIWTNWSGERSSWWMVIKIVPTEVRCSTVFFIARFRLQIQYNIFKSINFWANIPVVCASYFCYSINLCAWQLLLKSCQIVRGLSWYSPESISSWSCCSITNERILWISDPKCGWNLVWVEQRGWASGKDTKIANITVIGLNPIFLLECQSLIRLASSPGHSQLCSMQYWKAAWETRLS